MSIQLTDRPPFPGMPGPNIKPRINSHINHSFRGHELTLSPEAMMAAQQIYGLLKRFGTLPITGYAHIVIERERRTAFEGELTAYHGNAGRLRNDLVKMIDARVFNFKREYGHRIESVEFALIQTFVPEQYQARTAGAMSFFEYAQLAVSHGARCLQCSHPSRVVDLRHYSPHSDGWKVEGLPEKQWLFFLCAKCRYQTALSKLGIDRPVPKAV